MVKWETSFQIKPQEGSKGKAITLNLAYGKPPFSKPQEGMTLLKVFFRFKYHYCGNFRHYSEDCMERKYHDSKHRNRICISQFVARREVMNDDFKNMRVFILDVALSTKIDYSNICFVDYGAFLHISCNKH